jgi:hypothetical protein
VIKEKQVPLRYAPDDGQFMSKHVVFSIEERYSVNINISTKLHKEGKGRERSIRMHSTTGCCSVLGNVIQ